MKRRIVVGLLCLLLVVLFVAGALALAFWQERALDAPVTLPRAEVGSPEPRQVATQLILAWLERSRASLDPRRRLDAYQLESVGEPSATTEGLQVGAASAVRPAWRGPSEWMAGNGVDSGDGWIRHKFLFFAVRESEGVYTLRVVGTGP
jgi:hypothetical protein